MGKKAKGNDTPIEHNRAATRRNQNDAPSVPRLPTVTDEQRAALGLPKREELRRIGECLGLPKPEELRRIGERLGLKQIAENLRKTGRAPIRPQMPALLRSRKPGAGNKPKLNKDEVEHGKQTFRDLLDEDRTWANNQEAAAKHLLKKLTLGGRVSWQTVKRRIVVPVLNVRRSK
jgi:hypothetical protein